MEQTYKQPQARKQETEEVEVEPVVDHEAQARRDADIDAFLDEIDDVLEENAELFVSQYVQQGGE